MKAAKYQVTIGKDHRFTLSVPDAEGPAEVIVLMPDPPARGGTLAGLLQDLALRARPTRTREELDLAIQAERAAWE